MSGLDLIINTVLNEFLRLNTGFNLARAKGISMLIGVMLDVKSSNLYELAAGLPRKYALNEYGYRYIERILAHLDNNPSELMVGYAKDLLANLSSQGQTLVLMLDQSHINAYNEVLMASVRVGERALPLQWLVKECQGSMGFEEQKELLEQLPALFSENAKVLLTADRFYGTGAVIDLCQKHGYDYRIRLKGNTRISVEGVSMSVEEAFKRFPAGCSRVEMTATGIFTAIGFLHEAGHEEPWFIAMKDKPNDMRVLDYGLRWGIEAMFSDFKSRGFGIMQSQIQKERRLSMLIFVMTIAMYYAVSNGKKVKEHEETLKKS